MRRTAAETVETVKELDATATDLAIITGGQNGETYKLLSEYNDLARELGATTVQISDAAAQWLRQGKDTAETAELIEQSIMLSKVAMLDAETATKNLTSAMKGFNLATEDVSGIVDRLAALDSKAAVTAGDLAESMSRTAASANLAGVSMDRLLGYLSATQEVLQSSAQETGTSMRTILARFGNIKVGRFIDDETGEAINDVEGALKKVGIALRDTNDDFRSIELVLDELGEKWSSLSTLEQNALATSIAGTRQRNYFVTLMQNYGKALEYAGVAADSAGTALQKFDAYQESIEAKSAEFTAAMEGLVMDTVDPELVKDLIEAGTAVVEFTEKIGLLKAALVSLGVGGALKGVQAMAKGVQSVTANVMSIGEAVKTLRRVEDASRLTGNAITRLGTLTKGLSDDQLKVVLTTRQLSSEQMKAILMASGLTEAEAAQKVETLGLASAETAATAATGWLKTAVAGLSATIKASMVSNPVGWIMLAVSAVVMLTNAFDQAAEKARQAAQETYDNASAALQQAAALRAAYVEYTKYADKVDRTAEEEDALKSAVNKLNSALSAKSELLRGLKTDTEEYAEAVRNATRDELESALAAAREEKQAAKDLLQSLSYSDFSGSLISIDLSGRTGIEEFVAAYETAEKLMRDFFDETADYGAVAYELEPVGWDNNHRDMDRTVEYYHSLLELKKQLALQDNTENDIYERATEITNNLKTAVEQYVKAKYDELSAEYELAHGIPATVEELGAYRDYLRDELSSMFAFEGGDNTLASLLESYIGDAGFSGLLSEMSNAVDSTKAQIAQVQDLMGALLNARKELDALSKHNGNVDLFRRKKIDITEGNIDTVKGWGMDAEIGDYMTVASQTYRNGTGNAAIVVTPILPNGELLTQDELDSYIDDLIFKTTDGNYAGNDGYGIVLVVFDEENSWDKNLAKADEFAVKIHNLNADVVELSENIGKISKGDDDAVALLRQQNEELEAQAAQYKELSDQYHEAWALRSWYETTAQIARNNAAIEEYLSLLDDAATVDISSPWEDVFCWFDGYTSIMQQIAEIQAEVADRFVISAAKAREFAAVYPEILENATVAANGEIQLDADVVNTFLQGKRAELDAQIDTQIAQLKADKLVLEAKKDAAQAQLDIAQNIGEGEGQIAMELAEYRINAGNAVAQAMIDAGMDEAEAFRLAAASMAQNAEEFDRVAMEVCTNVDGNFDQVAYDAAQTMYNNLTNIKTDLASVALQAQDTARAISGIADGTVKGSTPIRSGSGGGVDGSGVSFNLQSGNFNGETYTYQAKTSSLEDFTAQLELDLSKYSETIATIDSQITMLRALKDAPIESFNPSGTGSGKSGGSGAKEVEEYIATLDDYREALKRLAETQDTVAHIQREISGSDNLKEQILLERELVDAYAEEQAALHNLNEQRRTTITAGVQALRELGFAVEYNADTNKLWIENLEHVNELVADSAGKYGTLQEATNALRKETEDLIDSLTDLNEANKDGSDQWWDLADGIKEAKERVKELLDEIVENASAAVDTLRGVYNTLHEAADLYAASGFVDLEALQKVRSMGAKYLKYLMDENGLLVINEDAIRAVIAAKTEEMAVETAMSYIEAVRIAHMENDVATLRDLTSTTLDASGATWELVYANAAILKQQGLADEYYDGMMNVIDALHTLADSAISSIGKETNSVRDTLQNMKSGLDDILKYVMDTLKQRINDQIDALEDMKDAYSEIIDQKKESLKASKAEADYQKTLASKMKELAKLQARYDALSLDNSRAAQAERAALTEEMAKLQEDLADTQADHTLDATEDALDKMEKAYHDERDAEIDILENTISSYQKLYDKAIAYISEHWDTLYNELIAWNTEYGNVLNSEITTAWENCLAAAQRYGDYVSALSSIDYDLAAASAGGGSGLNTTVRKTNTDRSTSNEAMAHAWVDEMKRNSAAWHNASDSKKSELMAENKRIATQELQKYGVSVYIDEASGTWYLRDGRRLYDVYHKGGIVGDNGSIKDNERLALLEDDETVLTKKMFNSLGAIVDNLFNMDGVAGSAPNLSGNQLFSDVLRPNNTVSNVSNSSSNQAVNVNFGDTVINGASPSGINQHFKLTQEMKIEIARWLGFER